MHKAITQSCAYKEVHAQSLGDESFGAGSCSTVLLRAVIAGVAAAVLSSQKRAVRELLCQCLHLTRQLQIHHSALADSV